MAKTATQQRAFIFAERRGHFEIVVFIVRNEEREVGRLEGRSGGREGGR